MSLLEIVAMLPSLEIRHLQPVGRIAANYICPSTADPSKVRGDSLVSEFPKSQFLSKNVQVNFNAFNAIEQ